MKGIRAYYICKEKGLIHPKMPYKYFKFMKKLFCIERWDDYVRHLMHLKYFDWVFNNTPLDEIRIPEVNMQIGGTITVELEKI